MKKTALALTSLMALAVVLSADSQHILRASFPDGSGLEIFTQTTGSTQIDPEGGMGIGPGTGTEDLVNRMVVDRANNILFVYNLEASRGKIPGTMRIRISPISPATESGMLNDAAKPGRPRFSGPHLPTVAGVREFPAVRIGEVVTLDILQNPASGEKIYDVLRPMAAASPGLSVTVVPAPETISLKEIAIRVNGQAIPAPAAWMVGAAVRIDIPRHGTYILTAYDPRESSPDHGFRAQAQAEGNTLSWTMGRDRVEITSGTNVMTRSVRGTLWLYHDPHYQASIVGLQSADTVEWLLPKR